MLTLKRALRLAIGVPLGEHEAGVAQEGGGGGAAAALHILRKKGSFFRPHVRM